MQRRIAAPLLPPGAFVLARRQRWRVVDSRQGSDCVVVGLSPLDGRARPVSLLLPSDRIQPIPRSDRVRWVHRRVVARACAAALVDAHPWASVPSVLRSNVSILPFQLEPVLALLGGECTRLLLADEVGLGKTIQAALIVKELVSRQEAERVLVVTPAGLRDQWQRELRDRCDVAVQLIDAAWLAEAGRVLPPWADPWSLPGIALISIDLLKRPEVIGQLTHASWDLVVVDEAHHAAQPSERRDAVALVCARSRYVVLLTATPYCGAGGLDRLLNLGQLDRDPSPVRIFRRDRAAAGLPHVPRKTHVVAVRLTAAERALMDLLDRYTRRVWREAGTGSDARLAMIVLRKRALSSPWSLARSVERRLAALACEKPAVQMTLAFDDGDGDSIADDDEAVAALGAPGLNDTAAERELLERLLWIARNAERMEGPGSKLRHLVRALARCREPVIVFTEYRDTLQHVARHLEQAFTIARLHGGLLPAAREAAIETFTRGPARVLVATDAAGEGLNLHARCRWIVHFELPWSANRLEQRAGRVDRFGQERTVHVWSLVAAETDEQRVLARLRSQDAAEEEEVARAIFDGCGWRTHHRAARTGRGPSAGEAGRLESLVGLSRLTGSPASRPVAVRVRRRGPFARFSGNQLHVYRADLCDKAGRRIASEILAVETGSERTVADRIAKRILGRRLRRSVSAYRSFARAAAARARALAARLQRAGVREVQPSLFDRRAARDAERSASKASEAIRRLLAHADEACGKSDRLIAAGRRVATIVLR